MGGIPYFACWSSAQDHPRLAEFDDVDQTAQAGTIGKDPRRTRDQARRLFRLCPPGGIPLVPVRVRLRSQWSPEGRLSMRGWRLPQRQHAVKRVIVQVYQGGISTVHRRTTAGFRSIFIGLSNRFVLSVLRSAVDALEGCEPTRRQRSPGRPSLRRGACRPNARR